MNTITSSEQTGPIKITVTVEVSSAFSPTGFLESISYSAGLDNHSVEHDHLLDELRKLVPYQLHRLKGRIDSIALKHLFDQRSTEHKDSTDHTSPENSNKKNEENIT